jgi:hypothetical protein
MGWFGIAMFGGFAIVSILSLPADASKLVSRVVSLGFAGFTGLSLYCVVTIGPVVLDERRIVQTCPIGTFQIFWEEVVAIDKDPQSDYLVFRGRGKQLAILGPGWWSRHSRAPAWAFIEAQAAAREIPIRQTVRAAFSWSKGVRVDSRDA